MKPIVLLFFFALLVGWKGVMNPVSKLIRMKHRHLRTADMVKVVSTEGTALAQAVNGQPVDGAVILGDENWYGYAKTWLEQVLKQLSAIVAKEQLLDELASQDSIIELPVKIRLPVNSSTADT